MNTKVYISVHKSEKDGENHKALTKMLKKLNCKPYWFKKHPYDNVLVDEADMVIILPHYQEDLFTIGNGIFGEMTRSSNKKIPTFFYNKVSKTIQQLIEVKLYPKVNGKFKDWLNVGYLVNSNQPVDIKQEIDLLEKERLDKDLNEIINLQT